MLIAAYYKYFRFHLYDNQNEKEQASRMVLRRQRKQAHEVAMGNGILKRRLL